MIFTYQKNNRTLRNKTHLLTVNSLIVLCFYSLFFCVEIKAKNIKRDLANQNPKIFRLCGKLEMTAREIFASDNNIIILRTNSNIIGIDSVSFLKTWSYEIAGDLYSQPKLEDKRLIFETIDRKEDTLNSLTKEDIVQISKTILNVETGIPTEVTKRNEIKNNKNTSEANFQKNQNSQSNKTITELSKSLNSDLSKENSKLTVLEELENKTLLGYNNGELILLNNSTKLPIWKTKVGGEITDIKLMKGRVLTSSKDNFLYLLNLDNANKIWKKRMPGQILKTLIIDENLAGTMNLNSDKIHLIYLNSGNDAGTIIPEHEIKVLEIKKISEYDLILLTELGVSLYSENKCRN